MYTYLSISQSAYFTFSQFYFSSNELPQGPTNREEPSKRFVRFHYRDYSIRGTRSRFYFILTFVTRFDIR